MKIYHLLYSTASSSFWPCRYHTSLLGSHVFQKRRMVDWALLHPWRGLWMVLQTKELPRVEAIIKGIVEQAQNIEVPWTARYYLADFFHYIKRSTSILSENSSSVIHFRLSVRLELQVELQIKPSQFPGTKFISFRSKTSLYLKITSFIFIMHGLVLWHSRTNAWVRLILNK